MVEITNAVRGFDITKKVKKLEEVFIMFDVGPSTEDTNEELVKSYVEVNAYRDGKTFDELLDQENKPDVVGNQHKHISHC